MNDETALSTKSRHVTMFLTACYNLPTTEINATTWSTEQYLMDTYNFTFNFDLLLNTEFIFQLRTIKLRVNLPYETPECYRLTGKVQENLEKQIHVFSFLRSD